MSVFRQQALKQLEVTPYLQPALQVISMQAWIWLLSSVCLITATLIWLFYGNCEATLSGQGILIPHNGQVISVPALYQGVVTFVAIKPGKKVKKHDLLAVIESPYSTEKFSYLTQVNQDNKKLLLSLQQSAQQEAYARQRQYAAQQASLRGSITAHEQQAKKLAAVLAKEQHLFRLGMITEREVLQSKSNYLLAQDQVAELNYKLQGLRIEALAADNNLHERLGQHKLAYLESSHQLANNAIGVGQFSKLVSPVAGTVLDVNAMVGEYIDTPKTLVSLMTNPLPNDTEMEVVGFINAVTGKRLKPGMPAYVLPTFMSEYEHGYILAQVSFVSDYPVTKGVVYAYLGNSQLVEQFFQQGAPYLIKLKLRHDPTVVTDLAWTSKQGAPLAIPVGSLATIKVVYQKKPLIYFLYNKIWH